MGFPACARRAAGLVVIRRFITPNRGGLLASRSGLRHPQETRMADDGLMSEMEAIEIAQRDHPVAKRGRHERRREDWV